LYELGRLNEAFEKVQTLLRFKPDQKDYLDFLARYYINTREVDKAIAQYEKIARIGASMDHEIAWLRCLSGSALCISQLESALGNAPEGSDQRAITLYRLGLVFATDRSTQNRSSSTYEQAAASHPFMSAAERSHRQYLEFFPQHRRIIEKNLEIYFRKK
jgi:tetratricopeptide (TPR) repeat protein